MATTLKLGFLTSFSFSASASWDMLPGTEIDGIFLLLVDKAGPITGQGTWCRDKNALLPDARSDSSDHESITSQGSMRRRSANSRRTRTQLGRPSQSYSWSAYRTDSDSASSMGSRSLLYHQTLSSHRR